MILQLHELHFKCAIATCGGWLPISHYTDAGPFHPQRKSQWTTSTALKHGTLPLFPRFKWITLSALLYLLDLFRKKCIEHPLYCMCCRNYWEIRNKPGTISVFKEHTPSRSPAAEPLLTWSKTRLSVQMAECWLPLGLSSHQQNSSGLLREMGLKKYQDQSSNL